MNPAHTLSLLALMSFSSAFAQTPQHPLETTVIEAGVPNNSPRNPHPTLHPATPRGRDAASFNPPAINDDPVPFEDADITKSGSDNAAGILSIVAGVVMIPVGLAVSASSSFEKCEENDGIGFTGGFGPCSESGPSRGGQIFGVGISVGGVAMIGRGIYLLGRDGQVADPKH